MRSVPGMRNLFDEELPVRDVSNDEGATTEKLQRLDVHGALRKQLLQFCRLNYGDVWEDPVHGHRVGVLDATKSDDVRKIAEDARSGLVVNDPPYNVIVGSANTKSLFKQDISQYLEFSRKWLYNAISVLHDDAHLYMWIGADYKDGFQPLPDLMLLFREFTQLKPRNMITMRNQRGYGTQRNWMWVRQELLYYTKGNPNFNVNAEYTDIPRILKGYYKEIGGKVTENSERSKSDTIRAGNVWVDIQQVFYRLEENVPGCYAQKPLKAIERIIEASTERQDLVFDFFAHSGTTLIAGERLGRKVYTFDSDPIFAEITIRRLERFRETGKVGWQWNSPFDEANGRGKKHRWI